MSEILSDLLLPFFFAVIFLIMSREREDRRLYFWTAGWFLQAAGGLILVFGDNIHPEPLRLFLVGLCHTSSAFLFLLSFPAHRGDFAGVRYGVLGMGVPLVAGLLSIFAAPSAHWIVYGCIAAGHIAGVAMVVRRYPTLTAANLSFLLALAFGSFAILLPLAKDHTHLAAALIPAEVLAINALSFVWNYRRAAGPIFAITGLVLWIACSPAGELLLHREFEAELMLAARLLTFVGMGLTVVQEDLARAHRLHDDYKALFDSNPHMMWTIEPETLRIVSVNAAGAEAHGYTVEEFLQLQLSDIIAPSIASEAFTQLRSPVPVPNRASIHIRKDGSHFPVDIEARTVEIYGKPHRLIMGTDVAEREKLVARLAYQAVHDALTGLLNRAGFQTELEQLVADCKQSGEIFALLKINIDRFRNVNDTYGETVGDLCLQALSSRILDNLRAQDIVGRTSEFGFSIILRGLTNPTYADRWARLLISAISDPVEVENYSIRLNLGIGMVIYPEDGVEMTVLRQKAWNAAARSRQIGNNTICRHRAKDTEDAQFGLRLEGAIREMLADGSFEVHYQPICRTDGSVCALEALVRMNHPKLGRVSPATFIPIAEESGLIVPLGQWIFEHACHQLNHWEKHGINVVPIAINISALQFRLADFAQGIKKTLHDMDIRHDLIHLELTESTVLRNIGEAVNEMKLLSELGIHFSIDDFGTGYSSLGRLHEMPISYLKIDRSFINGLIQYNSTEPIVRAIVSMAHALHMQVVAEGVETADQLAKLEELGCDLIQGYLFSPPVPPGFVPNLITYGAVAN